MISLSLAPYFSRCGALKPRSISYSHLVDLMTPFFQHVQMQESIFLGASPRPNSIDPISVHLIDSRLRKDRSDKNI